MLILSIVVLVMIVALVLINQKVRTDNNEKIMYLSLLQAENAFNLDLHLEEDTHKGLSKVDDLNTLPEPTKVTSDILARWKLDYIMSKTPSDHPVVEEAMERMENEEQ